MRSRKCPDSCKSIYYRYRHVVKIWFPASKVRGWQPRNTGHSHISDGFARSCRHAHLPPFSTGSESAPFKCGRMETTAFGRKCIDADYWIQSQRHDHAVDDWCRHDYVVKAQKILDVNDLVSFEDGHYDLTLMFGVTARAQLNFSCNPFQLLKISRFIRSIRMAK